MRSPEPTKRRNLTVALVLAAGAAVTTIGFFAMTEPAPRAEPEIIYLE